MADNLGNITPSLIFICNISVPSPQQDPSVVLAVGLACRGDHTRLIMFHKQCAAAVLDAISGALCGGESIDHFIAMWRRRKWLEQEGSFMPVIFYVGLKLAEHWSTLNLALHVTGICEETGGWGTSGSGTG